MQRPVEQQKDTDCSYHPRVRRPLQILIKSLLHIDLQAFRANDADVWNPIANNRKNLIGVPDLRRDDQAAIFKLFLDDLIGDQFATLEVSRLV